MSDHDTTIPPENDDEIRARLRAFAEEVKDRVDTEAALQRMPHRTRPPTIRLLAIAACLLAVVAVATVVIAETPSVETISPSESPATECPSTTQPRAITQGAQMKNKFAAPVASAATAILLLGACSDDATTDAAADPGPTTLAKGEDVEFVGDDSFGGQTLSIDVVEENGEVTGEFSVSDIVFVRVDCADTSKDGYVRVAGTVTKGDPTHLGDVGDLLFLTIREGNPDSAGPGANDLQAKSCTEMLDSLPDSSWGEGLVDVEAPSDIETG